MSLLFAFGLALTLKYIQVKEDDDTMVAELALTLQKHPKDTNYYYPNLTLL